MKVKTYLSKCNISTVEVTFCATLAKSLRVMHLNFIANVMTSFTVKSLYCSS